MYSMALGTDYSGQDCSLARALEIVGERWTLLIVRDAMFGVRRFSDFERRLDISKAVLAQRLSALVDAGVMERVAHGGRDEYVLTEAGEALWPVMRALTSWGDAQTSPRGPRRLFRHISCGTDVDVTGRCPRCDTFPPPADLETRPGPGASAAPPRSDISAALREPHRLLTPVRG
jgi:DNA-binding HxlR family transcriptional regulator